MKYPAWLIKCGVRSKDFVKGQLVEMIKSHGQLTFQAENLWVIAEANGSILKLQSLSWGPL